MDYNKNSADFGQVLKNCRFRVPITVNNYAVFYVRQNEQIAGTLDEKMRQAGRGFGVEFSNCRAVLVNSPRSDEWAAAIKREQASAMQGGQPLKLCVFVLPDNRADR